jgi:hypothetical protein
MVFNKFFIQFKKKKMNAAFKKFKNDEILVKKK